MNKKTASNAQKTTQIGEKTTQNTNKTASEEEKTTSNQEKTAQNKAPFFRMFVSLRTCTRRTTAETERNNTLVKPFFRDHLYRVNELLYAASFSIINTTILC